MRNIIFFFIASIFCLSCGLLQKKGPKEILTKINHIKRLSKYLIKNDNKTYDLNYSLINLPSRFDTLTWTNEAGTNWKGNQVDSTHNRYFIYGIMLDSLLLYKNDLTVTYKDLIKHFGEPSISGTKQKGGNLTKIFYFFNTKFYPDCSIILNKNQSFGSNCSLLVFEIDEVGNLNKVNKMMFYP